MAWDSVNGMNFCKLYKQRGTVAALLIIAASVPASVLSYGRIARFEERPQILVASIPFGRKSFLISHLGLCIGGVTVAMDSQPRPELRIEGEVRAAYRQLNMDAKYRLHSWFDAEGQMVMSRVHFAAADLSIDAEAQGFSPIRLKLEAVLEKKSHSASVRLPGPIRLKKNPEGSFRLEYVSVTGGMNRLLKAAAAAFADGFTLVEADSPDRAAVCQDDGGHIDLAPLFKLVNRSANEMKRFTEVPGSL